MGSQAARFPDHVWHRLGRGLDAAADWLRRGLPLRATPPNGLPGQQRLPDLGEKSAALLFPGRPALGEWMLLNGTRFQVIGVAGTIARGNNDSDNQRVYIPLTTMLELFPLTGENIPQDAVTSLQYQPTTKNDNLPAVEQVHAVIARQHGFDPNAPDVFEGG